MTIENKRNPFPYVTGNGSMDMEKLLHAGKKIISINEKTSNKDLLTASFSTALMTLLDPASQEIQELSFTALPLEECVEIFLKSFSILSLAGEIVNQKIFKQFSAEPVLTLLVSGAGTQILSLLEKYSQQPSCLKKIRVILTGKPKRKIRREGEAIGKKCNEMGIKSEFHLYNDNLDRLTEPDWTSIKKIIAPPLIFLASLTLHHISNDEFTRQEMFRKIKTLNPASFFLVEPDVDHVEYDLFTRIKNCWDHFMALFRFIDNLTGCGRKEKLAMKEIFKYEILDIMSQSPSVIKEGHNSHDLWVARARKAGFVCSGISADTIKKTEDNLVVKDGMTGTRIKFEDVSLLSIFHFI